jgi:hypothetical protein
MVVGALVSAGCTGQCASGCRRTTQQLGPTSTHTLPSNHHAPSAARPARKRLVATPSKRALNTQHAQPGLSTRRRSPPAPPPPSHASDHASSATSSKGRTSHTTEQSIPHHRRRHRRRHRHRHHQQQQHHRCHDRHSLSLNVQSTAQDTRGVITSHKHERPPSNQATVARIQGRYRRIRCGCAGFGVA